MGVISGQYDESEETSIKAFEGGRPRILGDEECGGRGIIGLMVGYGDGGAGQGRLGYWYG